MCLVLIAGACRNEGEVYTCPPCDQFCDEMRFSGPGTCPHCRMELVRTKGSAEEKALIAGDIVIHPGSGAFMIEGGAGRKAKRIMIFYHKPGNYTPDSPILIVVPGAGRNGDDYRDAWIEASEQYNVLILSPAYPEGDYGFGDYHLGGVMKDLNLENSVEYVENTNWVRLDEETFTFTFNPDSKQWTFNDFDRLFDLTVKALGSTQTKYDIFGHSAGGQILHRMAIFHPESKADRIIAANAGFYTLPDTSAGLPFGVKATTINERGLSSSFENNLTLLLGELDNTDETGGTLLRSLSADRQGFHRLARGKHFFKTSKQTAADLGAPFNWKLKVVSGVGHQFGEMGVVAADILYGANYSKD